MNYFSWPVNSHVLALIKDYSFCGKTIVRESRILEKIKNFSSIADDQLDFDLSALTNDSLFCGETILRES